MGKDTFPNHWEGVTSVVQGPSRARLRLCVAGRGSPFCTAIYPLGGAWSCDSEPSQVSAHSEGLGAVLKGGARKRGSRTADCSAAPPKFVEARLEPESPWLRRPGGVGQGGAFSLFCIHSPV